jgi:hypothetical protein
MPALITPPVTPDPLAEFMAQQSGPLMTGQQWSTVQSLDVLRNTLHRFLGALTDEEKLDYVRLQKDRIDAQIAFEQATRECVEQFENDTMASLRAELKTLTGADIDPTTTYIHTRYLQPPGRLRRAAYDEVQGGVIKVASLTLWDAACLNYDGLTGWSYPGRTGLADASYLDSGIDASAADFIALVRRLDIGGQLQRYMSQALQASASLGTRALAFAEAQLKFALIEALKNTAESRVDRQKYLCVKAAFNDAKRWGRVEEMQLFIPHGVEPFAWISQPVGFVGHHVGALPGDSLSIAHIVFSVRECPGAFSFFPDRPGGALRHHDSHREACEDFFVAFQGFYSRGHVEWLYPMMQVRDAARLRQLAKRTPAPEKSAVMDSLVYNLMHWLPTTGDEHKVRYVRKAVEKTPAISLNDFYLKRCRANMQELANQTPGFLPTAIELFKTVVNEVISLLLTPAPGALKGLGRIRAFALFVALGQSFVQGVREALQGRDGELLLAYIDLADLLISGRLHTRLARTVRRRHSALYRRLSQAAATTRVPPAQALPDAHLLQRMCGVQQASPRDMAAVLAVSGTSRQALERVWQGAQPSASLVDAAHRFNADRLIDWVTEGADPAHPPPLGAFEVMAPLLTQLDAWPPQTALSLRSQQGLELRRYSRDASCATPQVVTVTVLENYQFGYDTPRRLTAHLPQAIAQLLPGFTAGEATLRQQLAEQARTLRIELFEALTRYAHASRSASSGAPPAVRALMPDHLVSEPPIPAVVAQLQALHPQLSLARLRDVLREHPLSAHQQTQLLEAQLEPEALYLALRAARRVARREAIVDGLFHPRRFDPQTQGWAADYLRGMLGDVIGRTRVVTPSGASPGGTDGFYQAVIRQLSTAEYQRLGLSEQHTLGDLRHLIGFALLRNRAPDGSFYPYRRDIANYASSLDAPPITPLPDAPGLYRQGSEHYLMLEGSFFRVDQAGPLTPWRIQHPSLGEAYAPRLAHNGAGAWRHEWENPRTWDGQRAMTRLGPLADRLTPDSIELIQQISAITPDILRRVHVRNEPPPVMLVETVRRFNLHQRVMAGVKTGPEFFAQVLDEVSTAQADELVGRAGVERADQITVLQTKVEIDRPQMERLFYRALCHESAVSANPLAQVLQRQFPGLTAAIAEDLVHGVTSSERRSLEQERVPLSMTSGIRWWLEYLRKTRAMEGVHLPAAASADSARLILHALPDIDGWPRHFRVEVWERARMIDSIGPVDGRLKRLLEAVNGHYQAYIPRANGEREAVGRPGPFLEALLETLPAEERGALGYPGVFGAEELREEIGDRLARHWEFADTLLEIGRRPWYNPPRRLTDGRVGYPMSGGDEWGPVDRQQIARLRQLFPAKTDQQAFALLENLSDSVSEREREIDKLFSEREAMDGVLEEWSAQGDATGLADRNAAAERIRGCWRKEDSSRGVEWELNLDDLSLEDLPRIPARFAHVRLLCVNDNRLRDVPSGFFRGFPDLRGVSFSGNYLEHLPSGLNQLIHLKSLNLANNRIKPNLRDVLRLQELSELTALNLSGNPLGAGSRLNLHKNKGLQALALRNSGLVVLPKGAVTLRALRVFDLRDNRIHVLTDHDLSIEENVHRAMDLRGNSLSQATYERLRRYQERPGYQNIDFGLSGDYPMPSPFIDRWLPTLPAHEAPMRRATWQTLVADQMTDRFFNVLGSISAYPPFIATQYSQLRSDITRRVWGLLDSALHNPRLRQRLVSTPLTYRNGGIDGSLLCITEVELRMLPVQILSGDLETAGPKLMSFYRGQRRLHAIDQRVSLALRGEPQLTLRENSRHILNYHMALAAALDLPLSFPQRFEVPAERPEPFAANQLLARVVAEERLLNWRGLLKQEEYWIEFLEKRYPGSFLAALGDFHRKLAEAERDVENGVIGENQYLIVSNALMAGMDAAKAQLVGQLTDQEWASYGDTNP